MHGPFPLRLMSSRLCLCFADPSILHIMSSRTKRTAKPAAAAARAPAAAAPPAKAKGRRRKAEETDAEADEGPMATSAAIADEAEEKSSISVPLSKRARASSPSPRRPNAVPASTAEATSSSSSSAAAAAPSAWPSGDPLSGQWSSFLHPSTPVPLRLLVDSLLPLLSLKHLAVGLAATSKGGLAEMVRFAELCRAEQERDALLYPIAPRKKSKGAHQASVPPPPAVSAASLRTLVFAHQFPRSSRLWTSRLRWLVQSVDVPSAVLDSTVVSDLAAKLPWIVSLTVCITSSVAKPHFAFPPRLQRLSVAPQRLVPSGKRSDFACEYLALVLESVASLQHLRSLTVRTSLLAGGGFGWESISSIGTKWLHPLAAMSGPIESLTLSGSLATCIPLLNHLPSLTELKSTAADYRYEDALTKWLREEQSELALKELPLTDVEIRGDELACFSSSLTDLRPKAFSAPDIGWIASCKALRRIHFVHYSRPSYYYSNNGSDTNLNPTVESVVGVVSQLHSLTDVCVRYKDLTDAHFERMLSALPQLTALDLQSDCITSLAPLSLHTQLPRQMRHLTIHLPKVPRDHVDDHIMRLTALESLNISGSFDAPLFARQLAPFLPPYPREPMHWLRSFTPRSDREAVPAPPVDLVARAAAHAAFDARVRAGEVRSAELLNAAQLSGVLTFLDRRDFSFAGRSCRAWRAAACLPSAWTLKSNSSAAPSVDRDSERVGSWLELDGSRLSPWSFEGHTRILRIWGLSPQMSPAILPQAPLWKHACAMHVIQLQSQGPAFGALPSSDDAIATISAMARLEALDVSWRLCNDMAEIAACMSVAGPRLRRARFVCLPIDCLALLRNVEQLELDRVHPVSLTATRDAPDKELLALQRLRSLRITQERWHANLGRTLRTLSHRQLRHLSVSLSDGMPFGLAMPVVTSQTFLPMLVARLAGQAVQPQGASALAPAAAASAPADVTPLDEGLDAESDAGDATAPALLESLRIESSIHLSSPLSLLSLLRLPRLRSLQLDLRRCSLEDPTGIDEAAARGEPMPPLESLSLSMFLTGTPPLDALARLHTLRELALHSTNILQLTRPCVARWVGGMPLLERLALGSVRLGVDVFAELSRMTRLRSLSLASATFSAPSELASLCDFPAMEELTLEYVGGVQLQEWDWMEEMGNPAEESKAADADADGGAAAAATVPIFRFGAGGVLGAEPASSAPSFVLLPALSRCRLLRSFRWCPSESVVRRDSDYTLSRSWIPVSRRSSREWQNRLGTERRRERQTLRRFLQAHAQRRQSDPTLPLLCIRARVGGYGDPYVSLSLPADATPPAADTNPSKRRGLARGPAAAVDDAKMHASGAWGVASVSPLSFSSSAAAAAAALSSSSAAAAVCASDPLARDDAADELAEKSDQAKAKLKAERLASIDPNAPAPKKKAKRRY